MKPRPSFFDLLATTYLIFPEWSLEQRLRWVEAKVYVRGRVQVDIGGKLIDDSPLMFQRTLPRDAPLSIVRSSGDVVIDIKRSVREMFR